VLKVQRGQRVLKVQRGQRVLKVQRVLMANKVRLGQRVLKDSQELMGLMESKGQRVLREFKERPVVQIHRCLPYPLMQLSSLQIHLAQSKLFSNLQRIW
jgi:hypothetical protein